METTRRQSELTPLLVVRGTSRAIDFYARAFGARAVACYVDRATGGVRHADLIAENVRFSVTEEARDWNGDAPDSLGGSPVVLQLRVDRVDAAFEQACRAGATVVFPLVEFCGERMGRVRDPFGHLWLISEVFEELSPAEKQRQRDAIANSSKLRGLWAAPQAPAHLHLVVGPVGAGKSTFALRLAREHRAVRMDLDEWMAALFRPDRPETGILEWYRERTERCIEQMWRQTLRVLEANGCAVLEIGLIQRRDRERFYQRVDASGYRLTIHVLDAPREVRRERVERRNRERGETFSMLVPPDIFELASDLWQPLEQSEREVRDVRIVPTGD